MSPSKIPPATAREGTGELMACLTLVAPSGMTSEDRTAWTAVARQTLSGIPADLLKRGCDKARRTCKFASEIVPTIIAEVQGEWDRRVRHREWDAAREANRNVSRLPEPAFPPIPHEETQRLIREAFAGKIVGDRAA